MMLSFLLLVMAVPSLSPMGVILISAPSVKNMVPTTIMAAPIRKHSKILEEMGVIVKHRIITIPMIGSTELSASVSFSLNFSREFFNRTTSFLSVINFVLPV